MASLFDDKRYSSPLTSSPVGTKIDTVFFEHRIESALGASKFYSILIQVETSQFLAADRKFFFFASVGQYSY